MHLTDSYKILHPNIAEYTFYSAGHASFSKIGHIIEHNTNLYILKYTYTHTHTLKHLCLAFVITMK